MVANASTRARTAARLAAGAAVSGLLLWAPARAGQSDATPAERAVRFLTAEVPRWPVENECFSCHNNGDAARALYAALRAGHDVPAAALRETTSWLQRPEAWDDNALGLAFSDQVLARIQFGGALVDAMRAARVDRAGPVAAAAALVASDQREDGSWRLDASGSIGSPATYGTTLATWAALRTLRGAADERFAAPIAAAERWLRENEVKTVLDAAAVVLGLGPATDSAARRQREACLRLLVDGRAPSGAWGAYLTSPTEPFDTAVVLLALVSLADTPALAAPVVSPADLRELIADGRAFLVEEQLDDGSWIETTRPPGQQSYAQWISTTGWATLALIETRNVAP